jgi:transcriptional regulator with XRE-family HTH domain
MSSVSEIVRKTREGQGLSMEAFGAALGVSKQAVSTWEIGRSVPDGLFLFVTAAKFSDWRRDWAHNCLAALRPEVFAPAATTPEQGD